MICTSKWVISISETKYSSQQNLNLSNGGIYTSSKRNSTKKMQINYFQLLITKIHLLQSKEQIWKTTSIQYSMQTNKFSKVIKTILLHYMKQNKQKMTDINLTVNISMRRSIPLIDHFP